MGGDKWQKNHREVYTMERLLKEQQVSKLFEIAPQTLRNWRWKGTGPKFIKCGGTAVRYRETDLRKWLDEQTGNGRNQ